MFKPVTGDDLSKFDPETAELYRRRPADPETTFWLLNMTRRARNHLPLYVDKETNPKIVEMERQHEQFWWKLLASMAFFTFAANEFSKIYYPYGVIIRRSIPISWFTYVRHRAPIAAFFVTAWYYQREFPRTQRMDLTSDTEQ